MLDNDKNVLIVKESIWLNGKDDFVEVSKNLDYRSEDNFVGSK